MVEVFQWISDHLAALVALGVLASSLNNRKKLKQLHIDINSRLTELLRSSGASERAEGILEGRRLGVVEEEKRTAERERVEDRGEKKVK